MTECNRQDCCRTVGLGGKRHHGEWYCSAACVDSGRARPPRWRAIAGGLGVALVIAVAMAAYTTYTTASPKRLSSVLPAADAAIK